MQIRPHRANAFSACQREIVKSGSPEGVRMLRADPASQGRNVEHPCSLPESEVGLEEGQPAARTDLSAKRSQVGNASSPARARLAVNV